MTPETRRRGRRGEKGDVVVNRVAVRRGVAVTTLAMFALVLAAPAIAMEAPADEAAAEEATEHEEASEHGAAEKEEVTAASATVQLGGFIAAALCVGISVIGAAWAVAKVGTAAMGAVAEKPELMGRSMVYVGLAEGLAIYGLIIAIMILGKL